MGVNVNNEKCTLCGACINTCPFGAIENEKGKIQINAACKMCRMCIKSCPQGALSFSTYEKKSVNKDEWKGVMVFVDHLDGNIHPVTFELIGKARELAEKVHQNVYCVFIGSGISDKAMELLNYGVKKVFVYDKEEFKYFRVDTYANAFEDCIRKTKPSIVLVGGTSVGRSIAPRLSVRFRTGLTADCTKLDVKENTDLIQIRPAFGGNIMAQIVTPDTRPQFATVRYKVMEKGKRVIEEDSGIELCSLEESRTGSRIRIISVEKRDKIPGISEAEVLVVGGRGLKSQKDLDMIQELAEKLGGQYAVTRPLVEAGWAPNTRQIGLSGRTVKPKLIITCGVSGAVQFTASMNTSEMIIAINRDDNAPIFKICHYGIVGDIYEVVPRIIGGIGKVKNYGV